MAENKKPSLDEMLVQLSHWHGEVKNFRNDGWTQKGYRKKIAAMRTQIIRITEDIRSSDELKEVTYRSNPRKEDADADGNATPVSNRSLSNRYSGDPRNKDSDS